MKGRANEVMAELQRSLKEVYSEPGVQELCQIVGRPFGRIYGVSNIKGLCVSKGAFSIGREHWLCPSLHRRPEPGFATDNVAGCDPVFEDQVSGMVVRRPGLDEARARLGEGDVLVVWRLDRLGRSLPHLIETIRQICCTGAEFRSLTESIDTTMAGGRLFFHMMGALAEFERNLIIERIRAGMKAAEVRGIKICRKWALTPAQVNHARQLVDQGETFLRLPAR